MNYLITTLAASLGSCSFSSETLLTFLTSSTLHLYFCMSQLIGSYLLQVVEGSEEISTNRSLDLPRERGTSPLLTTDVLIQQILVVNPMFGSYLKNINSDGVRRP